MSIFNTKELNNADGIYHLAEMLPKICKEECSTTGDCYNICKEWVEGLELSIPRDKCLEELKETGAWDDDELEDDSDLELNIKYLWLAAGYEL